MKLFIYLVAVMLLLVHVGECVIFSWLWTVDPLEQSSSSNHNSSSKWNPTTNKQKYCSKDHYCGAARYCHRHYRICCGCKTNGALCRRDRVCCKGLECVFGSCRGIVKRGNYLSKCKKDKHCNKGFCCAKSHGEFVCKPMLVENQICSVPEGGVSYTINHGCPCAKGLVCKPWRVRRLKGNMTAIENTRTRCQGA